MTHKDFIAEVAKRLEWTDEKTCGVIETIIEVVSAELKMNNPVAIDDFGTLKTDIQPEYILVNPETKERLLMPPAVEIIFEAFSQENDENLLFYAGFTPDEVFYNEVNNSFSQFEPTPLNEGIQFPGIPEIVAEDFEEESDIIELSDLPEESVVGDETPEVPHEKIQYEKIPHQESPTPLTPVFPPGLRSRGERERRSNKRVSSVWIPIAGGVAIIVASLFFFKGDRNR
ncbi:MAG: HU family DNA-binding protein [Proteiniphilum sp.]|uniref:HU family DNA-binding protein n=1 Tax=Proteiniphilum sp. TaxID=1926877 RepID=UPI002B1F3413|nr:HU family DNA-binding protein [Proteiniphilum sp.]MEA5130092.1 HU family DNA-binding protein [Proteiniphilum sp.]